jgi:Ninjurin
MDVRLTENKFIDNEVSKHGADNVDAGRRPPRTSYFSKKIIAEGMMDVSLLTANSNQLKFFLKYEFDSRTYTLSVTLIVVSLILQIMVGCALIFKVSRVIIFQRWALNAVKFHLYFKRQMKVRGNKSKAHQMNDFLVCGIFLITVINIFAASFSSSDPHHIHSLPTNHNGTNNQPPR